MLKKLQNFFSNMQVIWIFLLLSDSYSDCSPIYFYIFFTSVLFVAQC
jgi:hypothetical protein